MRARFTFGATRTGSAFSVAVLVLPLGAASGVDAVAEGNEGEATEISVVGAMTGSAALGAESDPAPGSDAEALPTGPSDRDAT